MIVRCVTAALDRGGGPSFHRCRVGCTEEQFSNGDHYEAAREEAARAGFWGEMVVFDEQDGPACLFKNWPPGESLVLVDDG